MFLLHREAVLWGKAFLIAFVYLLVIMTTTMAPRELLVSFEKNKLFLWDVALVIKALGTV